MELNSETDVKKITFQKAWEIYENSFPKDERREISQQKTLLHKDHYTFFSVTEQKEVIGIIAVWNLGDYSFIEHFAIRQDLRSKGFGLKVIQSYLSSAKNLIVLETERPEASAIAKRRIGFWQRLGFILNRYDYIQPPYSLDKSPVHLFLMTYPRAINQKEFEEIRKNIHLDVYGLKRPLTKI